MGGGLIEFLTENISNIGSQTLNQQSEWDRIWNTCRSQIGAAAADALDKATGSSLEERSQEYHTKSAAYAANVGQQGQAVNKIGAIATETNANMVRTIRG